LIAQKQLDADSIIPFDELLPYHTDPQSVYRSLLRTHRWEERSLKTLLENHNNQAMYAVVHGGIDRTMRLLSCKTL